MQKKNRMRVVLVAILALAIAAFYYFDLNQYLSFSFLKEQKQAFEAIYDANPFLTVGVYFLIYVAVTALSLPGATVMTLAGGFLFGFVTGTVVVSFASTIGATLAFLVARFLLQEWVQSRFGEKLKKINEGIEREGSFYLFTLRLVPLFPFFVINLVMGLTPINAWRYFVVSQIGMLPGTMVYVNAGTQLGQLESASGILSLDLLLSFAALGLVPLIAKKIVNFIRKKKGHGAVQKAKKI